MSGLSGSVLQVAAVLEASMAGVSTHCSGQHKELLLFWNVLLLLRCPSAALVLPQCRPRAVRAISSVLVLPAAATAACAALVL